MATLEQANSPAQGSWRSAPSLGLSLSRLGTESWTVVIAGFLAVTLPLVGFVSLLLRSQLDPQFHNHQAHFVIFGLVGGVAFTLGYAAGEAANRRGDARVLLLSWRSWRPGASWAYTLSERPASSSPRVAPASRSRSRSGCS